MVDQRSSGRIFKQVKRSVLLTDLSHDLHACGNVLMHIDIIRGMYTSLGTGDILVRMCGSWEKIMVDQRSSGRILKQVKHWFTYRPVTRPARMRKCSHAYRHNQGHVH